jgi:hypothetical protein
VSRKGERPPRTDSATLPDVPARPVGPQPRGPLDEDWPTEVLERSAVGGPRELAHSRDQVIVGSTIREIMNNAEHNLSDALSKLLETARRDLPNAAVDPRASLLLRHHFEFDRRVGYELKLKLFDAAGACVEVVAELDQDGRAIRRGSVFAKLIDI